MSALSRDDAPSLHLAFALVLVDLADTDAVAGELVEAFTALTGFKEPVEAAPAVGTERPDALHAVADAEVEEAFLEAESRPDEMWNANHAAEAALAQVEEGEPEGVSVSPASPFATATMASLLEEQGHADEARALRDAIDGEKEDSHSRPRADRDRIIGNARALAREPAESIMSFESILNEIVAGCPGCYGAALMGVDGIPIAQVGAEPGANLDADVDAEEIVSVMGVEFGRILEETRKASDSVEAGALDELFVKMGRYQLAIRSVDAEMFLVMVLTSDANAAKGRYLMRRYLGDIREEL